MPLLSTADYAQVRQVLDTSLDETTLPDVTIALPAFQIPAEAEIIRRYPTAQAVVTAGTANAALVKIAAIYMLASMLALSVPVIESEEFRQWRYTRQKVDWSERAAALAARADQVLSPLVEPGLAPSAVNRPRMFALAPGTRGL